MAGGRDYRYFLTHDVALETALLTIRLRRVVRSPPSQSPQGSAKKRPTDFASVPRPSSVTRYDALCRREHALPGFPR